MNRFLDGFKTKFKLPFFSELRVKDMEAKPKIVSFALEFCQTNLLVLSTHLLMCRFLPLFALCPETPVTQTMLSRCHPCLTFEIDIGCKVRNPLKGS